MNPALWYALIGAGLVGIGLHSLILTPNLLRKIIALNIMGNGTFLVLVSISKRLPGMTHPDPVPQAMVLTGVVVSVSATALALALLRRYYEATGYLVLPENRPGWGDTEETPVEFLAAADTEGVEDEH
jgi:multicomponent Na+:H+ antiporter subunit C